jgi:hypothetical protein
MVAREVRIWRVQSLVHPTKCSFAPALLQNDRVLRVIRGRNCLLTASTISTVFPPLSPCEWAWRLKSTVNVGSRSQLNRGWNAWWRKHWSEGLYTSWQE